MPRIRDPGKQLAEVQIPGYLRTKEKDLYIERGFKTKR
jgi:hypothetical protein